LVLTVCWLNPIWSNGESPLQKYHGISLKASIQPEMARHFEMAMSMDWFQGKSEPETIDFPIKYR